MSINPLLDFIGNSVAAPLINRGLNTCCSAKSLGKRVYQAGSAVFSGIGNWPFYGVAAAFGSKYSSVLGGILGVSEFASYFTFRLRNFGELRQRFFESGPKPDALISIPQDPESLRSQSGEADVPISSVVSGEDGKDPMLAKSSSRSDNMINGPASRCEKCKSIAKKVGAAALGLVAQFPFMVLVYYGNGENIIYPILTGVCEASFTTLSLLMSLESSKKTAEEECSDPALERKRQLFVEQTNRFLEELPAKYNDPIFARKIEEIFSDSPPKSEEERGMALLDLVLEARGLPALRKGAWDKSLMNIAKGVGLFISLYLTSVNGAVSYKGVKTWKSEEEALAVATAILVSLANIKLITKCCMDSATGLYEGIRDILRNQYRAPLAHAVSPVAWYIGRTISNLCSWLSFGTTAIGARDYIPKVGNAFIAPAPLSSALLLTESLNGSSDDLIMWAKSKRDPKAEKFNLMNQVFLKFKEVIEKADQETLRRFFDQLPNLRHQVTPPPLDPRTPLLMGQLGQS